MTFTILGTYVNRVGNNHRMEILPAPNSMWTQLGRETAENQIREECLRKTHGSGAQTSDKITDYP